MEPHTLRGQSTLVRSATRKGSVRRASQPGKRAVHLLCPFFLNPVGRHSPPTLLLPSQGGVGDRHPIFIYQPPRGSSTMGRCACACTALLLHRLGQGTRQGQGGRGGRKRARKEWSVSDTDTLTEKDSEEA